jgi:TP901 family phage tail tape measure protein
MAEEQIVTNIVAKSDFSNLIADLNKVSSALTGLQEKLQTTNKTLAAQAAVMNRSFAETMRSTGQFSTHFVSLSSDVDKFGSQLDRGQMKLGKFFQTYNQHVKTNGGLIRDLAKQQVQLQNSVLQPLGRNAEGLMQYNVHIPRGLDVVKNKTAIAKQELMIMNKVIQEGAGQLINWGKNTQWAGRQLTVGLTVPIAAFGKASADAFREADQQLVRLTKVYGGLSAVSSEELAKVRKDVSDTASELSKSYGTSFSDTIALAADIAATGKQGNELLGSIRETTRLAVLGEVDRQDAMKATLAIQTAFKQNTEELSQSINFLNAVENQTSTTLNDLVEAIPKAGPIVKGLGGDVKDLALYLTAMREGGINASEGANALKSGLASLINPTKVAKGMFEGFGISLTDIVQRNAGNTTATILDLQSALETLNPLQKQQALEQLFGKFQFARMNALFENLGKQGSQTLQVMDLMKASSEELTDLAGRELSQVTESASGKYRRAVEGLKADLAGIGEQFLKINTTLIQFVNGILNFVQSLPNPIKQALGFLGMITAAAGPLIMLTGVLGNFFGYIIKGASHFRALFKGGQGWKLLTPEILAAQKAGNLVEQTFYSDAKAASVLKQSIATLAAEFANLEQKAMSAAISVNPVVSSGGTVVMNGGGRAVNASHPLAGAQGTRSAAHHNPRSLMTQAQRDSQTIHSFTPAPIPLNQKIGAVPQIFMDSDLPRIEGLTASKGVSTGIVAGEAAKWHALMGTLSMMSKKEVADLKKEIARTGTFSAEINSTFGQLLPAMTKLTSNAASQSAAIVAELQAGKLTVDAARTKIIAINAELERMMGQTTTQVATSLGRTANLTQVPLVDQPIVSSTGKSNIKEIFRPKRAASGIIDKIARGLGVRTWGGGYSTETTMPKKFAAGGQIYGPGTGTSDSIPIMASAGEFIVNAKATRENLPLLAAINGGMGNQDGNYAEGGFLPATMLWQGSKMNAILAHPDQAGRRKSLGLDTPLASGNTIPGKMFADDFAQMRRSGVHPGGILYEIGSQLGYSSKDLQFAINPMEKEIRETLKKSGNITPKQYDEIVSRIIHRHLQRVTRMSAAKGRRVSLTEEIGSLGFQRNEKNKGIKKGSIRNIGFDGQKVAQPFVSTGGGIPADSMAGPHFKKMQELYPEEQRKATPAFGKGKTFKSIFGAERGHVGASLPFGGMPYNSASRGIHPDKYSMQSHGRKTFLGMPLKKLERGWANPRYVAPDPRSIALRQKWMRGYKNGGMVGGGYTPRKYAMGGMVGQMVGGTAGWMGGQALGSMVGGDIGGMIGGMAGSMVVPSMMMRTGQSADKSIPKLERFKGAIKAITMLPGPVKLLGVVLGVGAAVKTVNDKINEHRKIINLAFGPTEESAQRLGIKYNSLTEQMKDFAEQTKLTKAKIEEFYAATQNSGVAGLNLTIKQLAELKETVRKDFPDYVKMFDKASPKEVIIKAQQLKAQFVAGGMSAEEATKKIYAMVSVSNKANQAVQAIANEGFSSIKDKATAAVQSVKVFNALLKEGNTDQLATSFDTVITSLQEAEKALIGTKNAQGQITTSAEAFDATLKSISGTKLGNLKLDQEGVDALSKQNAIMGLILNKSDTVAGAYSKMKLYLSGVNLDLKSMDSTMASLAVKAVNLATQNLIGGKYKGISDEIKRLTEAGTSQKAIKTQQNVQKDLDAQIKKHQKIIDKIKEQADAKVEALSRQNDAEDYNLKIQKLQIQYQEKLASGDMAGAAQDQIDIQLLSSSRQKDLAVNAIRDKEKADVKTQELIIEGLQKKLDGSQKAVEKATAAADVSLKKAAELQTTLSNLTLATINAALGTIDYKEIANLQTELKKFGFTNEAKAIGGQGPMIPFKDGWAPAKSGIANIGKDALSEVINGNKTLSTKDTALLNFFMKNPGMGVTGKAISKDYGNISYNKWNPATWANTDNLARLVKENNLKKNDAFTYKGKTYKVTNTSGLVTADEIKMAAGGFVSGAGTGTSDSIPAMLSNGEYVINADSVKKYGMETFNAFNNKKYAMGGPVTRMPYANGGPVTSSGSMYNINVTLNGSDLDPNDVARAIHKEMKMREIASGRSRTV